MVISIIALLVGILLPALGAARKTAQSAKCLANMRSWAQAFTMFTMDDGLPYGTEKTWMSDMDEYISGYVAENKLCPSADDEPTVQATPGYYAGDATTAWKTTAAYYIDGHKVDFLASYGFNGYFFSKTKSGTPDNPYQTGRVWAGTSNLDRWWGTVDNVVETTNVPIFGDCNWRESWPHHTNAMPTDLTKGFNDIGHSNPAFMMGRYTLDRHHDSVNTCFIDGHAENTRVPDLWRLKWHKQFDVNYDASASQPPPR